MHREIFYNILWHMRNHKEPIAASKSTGGASSDREDLPTRYLAIIGSFGKKAH
jgi:hypothetical protein